VIYGERFRVRASGCLWVSIPRLAVASRFHDEAAFFASAPRQRGLANDQVRSLKTPFRVV
jgi:hypothetical protein